MSKDIEKKVEPGVCIPWEQRMKEYERIAGDKEVVKKVWEEVDQLAYIYIWSCLISW